MIILFDDITQNNTAVRSKRLSIYIYIALQKEPAVWIYAVQGFFLPLFGPQVRKRGRDIDRRDKKLKSYKK